MPKKHTVYWYQNNSAVAAAFLYHCRDRDLRDGGGIRQGSIVQGDGGFIIAEAHVPGLTGSVISAFRPNRECEWMRFTLSCMAHPRTPLGNPTMQELRPYNYVVAELTEAKALEQAKSLGIPVICHSDGKYLVNLEISRFQRQGKGRRATLL